MPAPRRAPLREALLAAEQGRPDDDARTGGELFVPAASDVTEFLALVATQVVKKPNVVALLQHLPG